MDTESVWMPRRVAWLLTHAALRSAEVPVLRSLGCEVWTQKAFPDTAAYRSCRADTGWDSHLTLPADELALLNDFDFYTQPITDTIADILNRRFDLVVIDGFALKAREALTRFRGPVLMRAFGIAHPNSYTGVFFQHNLPGLAAAIRSNYSRFHFGAFYEPVIPHEVPLLANRGFHLPITLPSAAWAIEGTWTGGDPSVFFVCPSINSHPECRNIYDNFKAHFGDLPHVIAGRQPDPVDDPCVKGFMDAGEYAARFRTAALMFYHSTEPRHLHYHPVEAMASGMPVVYMRGGLLEQFDTGSQAGACATFAEAREKARRIMAGDTNLVARIRDSQRTVLARWRPEVARDGWKAWFSKFRAGKDNMAVPLDDRPCVPPVSTSEQSRQFPYLDPELNRFNAEPRLGGGNGVHGALSRWLALRGWDSTRPRRMMQAVKRYALAVFGEGTLLPKRLERTRRWRRSLGLETSPAFTEEPENEMKAR
jgi:hypothetical protein